MLMRDVASYQFHKNWTIKNTSRIEYKQMVRYFQLDKNKQSIRLIYLIEIYTLSIANDINETYFTHR